MKKIIIFTITVLIIIIIYALYLFLLNRNKQSFRFPRSPTVEEREAAKKLPREECGCWDRMNNICLPQADCI